MDAAELKHREPRTSILGCDLQPWNRVRMEIKVYTEALRRKSNSTNRNVTVWLHGRKHHKNCKIKKKKKKRLTHSGLDDGAF